MAKKKFADMGNYLATDDEIKAQRWCIKNNILIAPFAHDANHWWIEITLNGKTKRSPSYYIKTLIWEKIFEYYVYYYNKYYKEESE